MNGMGKAASDGKNAARDWLKGDSVKRG